MAKGVKKIQLRRCAFCDKVGHNKSTCRDFRAHQTQLNARADAANKPARLNVFIHHVNQAATVSPHLVNLKKLKADLWDNVHSVAPADAALSPYHYYHRLPTKPRPAKKPLCVPLYETAANEGAEPRREVARPETPKRVNLCASAVATAKKIMDPRWRHETRDRAIAYSRRVLPWKKMAIATAGFAVVMIIPAQANSYLRSIKLTTDRLLGDGSAGFTALQDSTAALMNSDLGGAQEALNNALQKFSDASDILQNKHRLLKNIISNIPLVSNEVKSRQNLILAGQKIALGNAYLLKGISDSQSDAPASNAERIDTITAHLRASLPNYQEALEYLSVVKIEVLPLEYQAAFKDFRLLFAALINDFANLSELGQAMKEIFGGQGQRRYLLIFQNPNELRPSGGFMGSFAILDMKDGAIANLTVPAGGTYDLQGQLSEYVEPPTPLLLSNKRWEFQDANWFPDFSASAQKILWFYRKSWNNTADGVIAINATVLERLLALTGPLRDENRNLNLNADSAINTIQQVVEEGPEKQLNKPKQIIADLAPRFIEYFKNIQAKDLLPLLVNLQEALEEKEIQAYFTEAGAQNIVKSYGWSGKVLSSSAAQDYLLVVNANIQGQKSDAAIKQTISHQALVQPDGSIIDMVLVTREHQGKNGEKLYGQTNIDYIRIYVPEGSELVSAGGFNWPEENKFRAPDSWTKKDPMLAAVEKEIKFDALSGTRISAEFGKTAFGNWLITEPGQISQAQFVYRLPFRAWADAPESDGRTRNIADDPATLGRYQLVAQRQSGCASEIESQIIFPNGWKPRWSDGAGLELAANGARLPLTALTKDAVWSLVMTRVNN